MSLITCPDCRAEVSRSAKACPQCGASAKAIIKGQPKTSKRIGKAGKIGIGVATAAFVALGAASIIPRSARAPSAADAKEDMQYKQRSEAAVADGVSLKQSLRDPDSLVFEKILASDDGNVVCVTYRARNGFGGMNRDHAVFNGGPGTTSAAPWRKHCAHVMLNDVTEETVRMVGLLGH
jgi:hypothetical protein